MKIQRFILMLTVWFAIPFMGSTHTIGYGYDSSGNRVSKDSVPQIVRYYLGDCYELDVKWSGQKRSDTERVYLFGDYYKAPLLRQKTKSAARTFNLIRDYLGSVTTYMTSSVRGITETGYDAWGRPLNASDYTPKSCCHPSC